MQPSNIHYSNAITDPDRYIYFLDYCGWHCEERPTTGPNGDRWMVTAHRDGHTVIARWPTIPLAWRAAARLSVWDKLQG
jgi:hypothetical protein